MCHLDKFGINISICFHRLLCGFLLSQHPNVISESDDIGPTQKTLKLNYKLFQGSHVPNLPQYFRPSKPSSTFVVFVVNIPHSSLHLPKEEASHIIQLLTVENCSLSIDIQSHTKAISTTLLMGCPLTVLPNSASTCRASYKSLFVDLAFRHEQIQEAGPKGEFVDFVGLRFCSFFQLFQLWQKENFGRKFFVWKVFVLS